MGERNRLLLLAISQNLCVRLTYCPSPPTRCRRGGGPPAGSLAGALVHLCRADSSSFATWLGSALAHPYFAAPEHDTAAATRTNPQHSPQAQAMRAQRLRSLGMGCCVGPQAVAELYEGLQRAELPDGAIPRSRAQPGGASASTANGGGVPDIDGELFARAVRHFGIECRRSARKTNAVKT